MSATFEISVYSCSMACRQTAFSLRNVDGRSPKLRLSHPRVQISSESLKALHLIRETISFRLELIGMLNLDTHILIKAFEGNLTLHERDVLTADPEWSISAIVLWEIATLHRLGRLAYGLDHEPLAAALDQVHIWPITRQLCVNLRRLDFQSDPADEIIAATSLTHNIPLLTRDSRIRRSKIVKLL